MIYTCLPTRPPPPPPPKCKTRTVHLHARKEGEDAHLDVEEEGGDLGPLLQPPVEGCPQGLFS